MKNIAIIVAGGKGKRLGGPKQFLKIAGQPMLAWTVEAFQKTKAIDGIILVVAKEQLKLARALRYSKIIEVVAGGKERTDSVRNGLKELPLSAEIVAIHDGARPMVTPDIIAKSIKLAKRVRAVVVGVPVKDTIKEVWTLDPVQRRGGLRTLDRTKLWAAQTPQVFAAQLIGRAYRGSVGREATDDSMLVEKMGKPVSLMKGSYENFKVTTPEDLRLAEIILRRRKSGH